MKDHILILNTPDQHGERYLRLLVQQIRETPSLKDCPIQVFSGNFPEGLPPDIATMGVALKTGHPAAGADFNEVDIQLARFIILMSVNTNDERADSINLDIVNQLQQYILPGHIIAECIQETNRERFKQHGADAVIRPVRAYPELMVRAMAAPGTEEILEDLFIHAGNHIRRYDVEFTAQPWETIAGRLLLGKFGIPLGYLTGDEKMVINPTPGTPVDGKAVYLMVNQDVEDQTNAVRKCVLEHP